jgi:hypothetical protein
MKRRDFLKSAGLAGVAMAQTGSVSIVLDSGDAVAAAGPGQWAAKQLQAALAEQGITVRVHQRLNQAASGDSIILAAGAAAPAAR